MKVIVATIKNHLHALPSYVNPACDVFKVIKRTQSAKTTVGNFISCSAQKENWLLFERMDLYILIGTPFICSKENR